VRWRTVAAFVLAPPAGLIAVVIAAQFVRPPAAEHAWVGSAGWIGGRAVYVLLGVTGAYLVEIVLGVPLYQWLSHRGRPSLRRMVAAGAVLGSLSLTIPAAVWFGNWGLELLLKAGGLGAVGGVAAVLGFWIVSECAGR
jgi:hypothetical protein